MVELDDQWKDDDLAQNWESIRSLRAEVTKALEEARKNKLIGHPLDAFLEIKLPDSDLKVLLENSVENLNDIFIVSKAVLVDTIDDAAYQGREIEGLAIMVHKAAGVKCERCWRFDETIGSDNDHPTACERCSKALKKIL